MLHAGSPLLQQECWSSSVGGLPTLLQKLGSWLASHMLAARCFSQRCDHSACQVQPTSTPIIESAVAAGCTNSQINHGSSLPTSQAPSCRLPPHSIVPPTAPTAQTAICPSERQPASMLYHTCTWYSRHTISCIQTNLLTSNSFHDRLSLNASAAPIRSRVNKRCVQHIGVPPDVLHCRHYINTAATPAPDAAQDAEGASASSSRHSGQSEDPFAEYRHILVRILPQKRRRRPKPLPADKIKAKRISISRVPLYGLPNKAALTHAMKAATSIHELKQMIRRNLVQFDHIHTAAALLTLAKLARAHSPAATDSQHTSAATNDAALAACMHANSAAQMQASQRTQQSTAHPQLLPDQQYTESGQPGTLSVMQQSRAQPKTSPSFHAGADAQLQPEIDATQFDPSSEPIPQPSVFVPLYQTHPGVARITNQLLQHLLSNPAMLQACAPRHLANVLQSLAVLQYTEDHVILQLLEKLNMKLHEADAWALSSALHAAAKLTDAARLAQSDLPYHWRDEFYLPIVQELSRNHGAKLMTAKPQDIALSSWAATKLGVIYDSFWDVLADIAPATYSQKAMQKLVVPQNWANLVYGFAKSGHYSETLFDFVMHNVLNGRMAGATPHEWADLLWSFAKVKHYSFDLCELACQSVARQLSTCTPQQFAHIMWALAQLNHTNSAALSDILSQYNRPLQPMTNSAASSLQPQLHGTARKQQLFGSAELRDAPQHVGLILQTEPVPSSQLDQQTVMVEPASTPVVQQQSPDILALHPQSRRHSNDQPSHFQTSTSTLKPGAPAMATPLLSVSALQSTKSVAEDLAPGHHTLRLIMATASPLDRSVVLWSLGILDLCRQHHVFVRDLIDFINASEPHEHPLASCALLAQAQWALDYGGPRVKIAEDLVYPGRARLRKTLPEEFERVDDMVATLKRMKQSGKHKKVIEAIRPKAFVRPLASSVFVDVLVEMVARKRVAIFIRRRDDYMANDPKHLGGLPALIERLVAMVYGPGNVAFIDKWDLDGNISPEDKEMILCRLLGLQD